METFRARFVELLSFLSTEHLNDIYDALHYARDTYLREGDECEQTADEIIEMIGDEYIDRIPEPPDV